MFGYLEIPYEVLESESGQRSDGATQELQLRCSIGGTLPYIAVEVIDAEGRVVGDHLFLYDTEALCRQDWRHLCDTGAVTPESLRWREYVQDHAIGHLDNGGVAMY